MRPERRWVQAWRATAYLLGTLSTAVATVLALPLLCVPALLRPWAQGHQQRTARLRGVPVGPHPTEVSLRRYLRWLLVHVASGVVLGLVAIFGVGSLILAAIVTPLWWVFPAGDPPRLLVEVPVTSWGAALTLGPLQVAVVAGLAYWAFPLLAGVHARITLAMLAPSPATDSGHRRVLAVLAYLNGQR